jgi:hypothetical protein
LVFAAAAFIDLFSRGITFVVWWVISVLGHRYEPAPGGALAGHEVNQGFREMGEASDEGYSADNPGAR